MAIKKIHKKCFLLLLAFSAFLCLENLLNALMSQFIVDDNYNFEEVTPINFRRLTIEDLIVGSGQEINNLLKRSSKEIKSNGQDSEEFHYQKILCKNMMLIKGMHNQFRICYPIRWFLRFQQQQQLAYFINGPRDTEFERNFKKVANNVILKVFTTQNTTLHQYHSFLPDAYRKIDVSIFSESDHANCINTAEIGIKDLIDSQDDYHHMEFMKYEMKDKIDPIVFSINIPVFSSHLLLRLENISFNEFEYLIKRLEKAIYFPYSVIMAVCAKNRFCSLIFLIFILIKPTMQCAPGNIGTTTGGAGGGGGGTATNAPGVNTVAPTAGPTAAPITCTGTEATGVRGITAQPGDGACGTCTGTTADCPAFNWPTVRAQGFEYVIYSISQGNAAACLAEMQNIKNAGIKVSPSHEAVPNLNSGTAQATFFAQQGGGAWVNDGLTLPGTLHLQTSAGCPGVDPATFNQGACCYGMTPAQLVQWISEFSSTYRTLTGRTVIISTDVPFWRLCMQNSNAFVANPLTIAFENCAAPTAGGCPLFELPWTMFTTWLDRRTVINGIGNGIPQFNNQYFGSSCMLDQWARAQITV